MGCHVLRCPILGYSVCLCPIKMWVKGTQFYAFICDNLLFVLSLLKMCHETEMTESYKSHSVVW